jgi:glucose/arabinose dehydrogenase
VSIVQPRGIGALVADVVLLSAAAPAQPRALPPGSRRFPLLIEPRVYQTFQQKIKVTVLAHGIERPWRLLPLPDGDFLIGVRPTGQVLALRKGVLHSTPLTGLPAMHVSRTTGMLDVVLQSGSSPRPESMVW